MTLNPDPLHVPEADPPRRSGCLSVLSLALLLAIALGIAPLQLPYRFAPTAEPDQPSAVGVVFNSHLSLPVTHRARWALRLVNDSLHTNTCQAVTPCPAAPSGSVTFVVTATATWCAPTPKQCQSWGGNAKLAAVNSFRDGDEPYLVRVKYGRRQVTVLVVSYCACLGTEHAIDLSPAAFKVLAPLSRGRIDVVLEWPVPELPRTDTDLRMQREVADDSLYR